MRQERFSSSLGGGLLANLVAKRCQVLDDPDLRAAIWLVQELSWKLPGGLADVARTMRKALGRPEPHRDDEGIEIETLQRLALDPHCRFLGEEEEWESWGVPIYRGDLQNLKDFRRVWIGGIQAFTETEISRRIFDALDFTKSARCLSLITGESSLGKSFAANQWCRRQAGSARYIEARPWNDDTGFFRAIAKALGVSSSLQLKAWEVRERIEETLQFGDLVLILDEAHYLWPQNWQRYAMPSRVNWLMTLVNRGIAVALVTTPQFDHNRKRVESLVGWNSKQFLARVRHKEMLPEYISELELQAVAKAMLPEVEGETARALAQIAARSGAHMGTLVRIASRARWFAEGAERTEACNADVARAVREVIATGDEAGNSSAPRGGVAASSRTRRGVLATGFAAGQRAEPLTTT